MLVPRVVPRPVCDTAPSRSQPPRGPDLAMREAPKVLLHLGRLGPDARGGAAAALRLQARGEGLQIDGSWQPKMRNP